MDTVFYAKRRGLVVLEGDMMVWVWDALKMLIGDQTGGHDSAADPAVSCRWDLDTGGVENNRYGAGAGFTVVQVLLVIGALLFFCWTGYTATRPSNDDTKWIHEVGQYGL
ncbi:hypothetical protein H2136_20875 [Aeromonas hydrophila]|uniref:Uncharacterized protein n=1 Tax=Aeromonas hydrophila TaxID=644 RepID=A0A926IYE4_AERHY|nr:hypothetical protein [Aeromonas hydrophila]